MTTILEMAICLIKRCLTFWKFSISMLRIFIGSRNKKAHFFTKVKNTTAFGRAKTNKPKMLHLFFPNCKLFCYFFRIYGWSKPLQKWAFFGNVLVPFQTGFWYFWKTLPGPLKNRTPRGSIKGNGNAVIMLAEELYNWIIQLTISYNNKKVKARKQFSVVIFKLTITSSFSRLLSEIKVKPSTEVGPSKWPSNA